MKKCKYCNIEINHDKTYCSNWCKEQCGIVKKNNTYKKHLCVMCNNVAKEYTSSVFGKYCETCSFNKNYERKEEIKLGINRRSKKKEMIMLRREARFAYLNETGIMGKCLNCGEDVIGYIHKKYIKKFCCRECTKEYSYKNLKNKNI